MDNMSALFFGVPLLVIGLSLLFLGVIGGLIGRAKGRATSGFWWGFFLGPMGWLIVALQTDLRGEKGLKEGTMKKCPYCAELIKSEARVCRYCGKEIPFDHKPEAKRSGRGEEVTEFTCSDCGAGVSKDDMICPKCGADISEEEKQTN
jgi:RNA polymerase subunit RPABC4/transcription elongation factor Spt4